MSERSFDSRASADSERNLGLRLHVDGLPRSHGDLVSLLPMPFDALRFFLPRFFRAFLFWAFSTATCPANAQSQSGQARTTPARQSPAAKQGLNFVVGAHGLDSLSFNGQSLLVSPESGELQPQKSVFRAVLDALLPRSSPRVATPNEQPTQSI